MNKKLNPELRDASGNLITSMGASWTSAWYSLGFNHTMLCAQLGWSGAPQGTLHLDYSAQPAGGTITMFETKESVDLDGSQTGHMFLDANLPVISYRLRFVRSSGTGALTSSIVEK